VSYAFYLVHQVLGEIVMNNLMLPRPVEITSALGVGLLTATALTSGIEQPAMRWLRAHRPAWAGQARKT
ncbi:MAG TPA: acyltransferase, partial [Alphaproteobacteria bacterium]|nr:acyltransferase [Alphaproteobacteria bacterium]